MQVETITTGRSMRASVNSFSQSNSLQLFYRSLFVSAGCSCIPNFRLNVILPNS